MGHNPSKLRVNNVVPHAADRRLREIGLEHEFQGQLALPRTDGCAGDYPELGIAHLGVRCAEHRMIEGVLGVKTQFQLHSFVLARETEVFGDGQVGSPEEG